MAFWNRKKDDAANRKPAGKPLDMGVRISGKKVPIGLSVKNDRWTDLVKTIQARRLGITAQRKLGATMAERLYLVENPSFSLFDGQVEFRPRLDHFSPPPKDHLAEGFWTTTGYLSFASNRLFRVMFECSGDEAAAKWFARACARAAEEKYGEGREEGGAHHWENRASMLTVTRDGSVAVVSLAVNPDLL